ncbi:hypothetical protein Tco_0762518, partial [Tanacetum coccineum]
MQSLSFCVSGDVISLMMLPCRRLLLKFGNAARAYFSLQDSLLLGKLDITCLEKELDISRVNTKTDSSMQEEMGTSCHDATSGIIVLLLDLLIVILPIQTTLNFEDNAFEKEEGETNKYYLPGIIVLLLDLLIVILPIQTTLNFEDNAFKKEEGETNKYYLP